MQKSTLRWTKAVAAGATWLIAPPYESNRIAPEPEMLARASGPPARVRCEPRRARALRRSPIWPGSSRGEGAAGAGALVWQASTRFRAAGPHQLRGQVAEVAGRTRCPDRRGRATRAARPDPRERPKYWPLTCPTCCRPPFRWKIEVSWDGRGEPTPARRRARRRRARRATEDEATRPCSAPDGCGR